MRLCPLVNDKQLKKGMPSQPVRIVGFKSLPKAGDPILCVGTEDEAEEIVNRRTMNQADGGTDTGNGQRNQDVELHVHGMRTRDTWRVQKFHDRANVTENNNDGTIRIPIVVKADADGSLSAIRDSLVGIGTESSHNVIIEPILEGIGDITESDILMAKESNATIFLFGLKRIDQEMRNIAESEKVELCTNDVIYSLLDEAKESMRRYLPEEPIEHIHGRALVQATFSIDTESGQETVAGLKVTDGIISSTKMTINIDDGGTTTTSSTSSGTTKDLNCYYRVIRDGVCISHPPTTDGNDDIFIAASSLRKYKELVEQVKRGEECGLALTGYSNYKQGDVIECYSTEMRRAKF